MIVGIDHAVAIHNYAGTVPVFRKIVTAESNLESLNENAEALNKIRATKSLGGSVDARRVSIALGHKFASG